MTPPSFFYDAQHPSARGAYMLRKSLVLVFIRLRMKARHHGGLLWK